MLTIPNHDPFCVSRKSFRIWLRFTYRVRDVLYSLTKTNLKDVDLLLSGTKKMGSKLA